MVEDKAGKLPQPFLQPSLFLVQLKTLSVMMVYTIFMSVSPPPNSSVGIFINRKEPQFYFS
jgi:hypothetical protein